MPAVIKNEFSKPVPRQSCSVGKIRGDVPIDSRSKKESDSERRPFDSSILKDIT